MRFTCKKCKAKYTIADEKLRGKVIKVRCKHCGQLLVVREAKPQETRKIEAAGQVGTIPKAPPPKAPADLLSLLGKDPIGSDLIEDPVLDREFAKSPPVRSTTTRSRPPTRAPGRRNASTDEVQHPPTERENLEPDWFVGLSGVEEGPYTLRELQERLKAGRLNRDFYVWREGMGEWRPIQTVPELGELFKPEATPLSKPPFASGKTARGPAASLSASQREKVVAEVLEKLEAVRSDRHAGRIADHFFVSGEHLEDVSEVLPPAQAVPVADLSRVARHLRKESEREENNLLALALPSQGGEDDAEVPEIVECLAVEAGVSARSRLLKTMIVAVGAALIGAIGVVVFGISMGWFGSGFKDVLPKINLVTNPGQFAREVADEGLTPEEIQKIRDTLFKNGPPNPNEAKPKEEVIVPSARPAGGWKSLLIPEKNAGFDNGPVAGRERSTTRSGPLDVAGTSLGSLSTSIGQDWNLPDRKKEETPKLTAPGKGPERLSDLQIGLVIQKHKPAVRSCLERQLKRDSSVSGKLVVVARVQPEGRVETVRLDAPKFHGTFVEECLLAEVKNWRFPPFRGEAYEVYFPMLLSVAEEQ